MTYLTLKQTQDLLDYLKNDWELLKIVEISLATGSRWRETITLKSSNLSPYRIRFTNTKTGKPRTVPISKQLYDDIYPENGGNLFSEDPQVRLGKIFTKLGFDIYPKGKRCMYCVTHLQVTL
ncbi:tyrosine-type recombinase/integrase [Vibrio neptunius]